jgi:hypothetical protein
MLAVYKASLILLAGLIVVYAFQGYYPTFISLFSNSLLPAIAGAAVISSGFSLAKYWHSIGERFSKVWLYLTVGLFLWFVSEAVGIGYTLVWGVEIPYPSVADAFWLSGCVPLFVALYLYVEIFKSVLSWRTLTVSMGTTLGLATFVSVGVMAPVTETKDLVTIVADFTYAISDTTLLLVAILGLLIFLRGNLGKSWALISSGVLLNAWADVLFSYTKLHGTYYAGHPIDLLYAVAYVFFLLAFYVHTKEL